MSVPAADSTGLARRIAEAAGLDPRDARHVSGVTDVLSDAMVAACLRGLDATQIVQACGHAPIMDGFRSRPLDLQDAEAIVRFVAHARYVLAQHDRQLEDLQGRRDALAAALTA